MNSWVSAPPAVSANAAGVIRLYRAALARCWLPATLLALLWAGLLALLIRQLTVQDGVFLLAEQLQELVSAPVFWRVLLGATLVSTVLFCALVASMYAVATGESLGTGRAIMRALRAFPAAVLAATIFMVLTSVGTMLLVIPGAYLWGMWQLWVVALMAERAGPWAALRRSWQLTRGFWWPAMTLTTLATLASTLPLLVLNLLAGTWLALLGVEPAHALLAMLAALAVLASLLVPVLPAALVALYVDRQRRATPGGQVTG